MATLQSIVGAIVKWYRDLGVVRDLLRLDKPSLLSDRDDEMTIWLVNRWGHITATTAARSLRACELLIIDYTVCVGAWGGNGFIFVSNVRNPYSLNCIIRRD